MFSGRVQHVAKTRIFARPIHDGQQLLVYAMRMSADDDVAMVLPIPVPKDSREDAVRFVDMSKAPRFFDDVDAALFPVPVSRHFQSQAFGAPQAKAMLVVHDVGDFEASFVPNQADFERLDPRFRLAPDVWSALPQYDDWGFAVFKLRAAVRGGAKPPPPEPGLLGKIGAWFGPPPSELPAPPRDFHPMAFEMPRRDPTMLFFPTTHVHDGAVHRDADFDHQLFCQRNTDDPLGPEWLISSATAGIVPGEARTWLDAGRKMHKRVMQGVLPNGDVLVAV